MGVAGCEGSLMDLKHRLYMTENWFSWYICAQHFSDTVNAEIGFLDFFYLSIGIVEGCQMV